MTGFSLATHRREDILDITAEVQEALSGTDCPAGALLVSVPHCTCALYLNEHEDGLLADTLALLEELTRSRRWQHDRIDDNAAAHLGATVLGHAVLIPVRDGRLVLGTWQRLLLVELDGPRRRQVHLTLLPGRED